MLSYRYSTVPINKFRSGIISVVDLNTLNLDPNPEFWSNMDPEFWSNMDPEFCSNMDPEFWPNMDPDPGLCF